MISATSLKSGKREEKEKVDSNVEEEYLVMKGDASVWTDSLFPCAKGPKILGRSGGHSSVELHHDPSLQQSPDTHIEKASRICRRRHLWHSLVIVGDDEKEGEDGDIEARRRRNPQNKSVGNDKWV